MMPRSKQHKKVGVISGGGSGHEPLHAGYVGQGMLDAAGGGPSLHIPDPGSNLTLLLKKLTKVRYVLMIVKNYSGDG